MLASYYGHKEVTGRLISAGANVDLQDKVAAIQAVLELVLFTYMYSESIQIYLHTYMYV